MKNTAIKTMALSALIGSLLTIHPVKADECDQMRTIVDHIHTGIHNMQEGIAKEQVNIQQSTDSIQQSHDRIKSMYRILVRRRVDLEDWENKIHALCEHH